MALESGRTEIDRLLQGLHHPYHNREHALFRLGMVMEMAGHLQRHERLEKDAELLLETCALALDLGRPGSCGIPSESDGRNYEERAADMAEDLFNGRIPRKSIRDMRDLIMAYPSRWNDYEKGIVNKRMATSKAKRILGLSDVFYFSQEWDVFLESAFRLAEECPFHGFPFPADGFIDDCKRFLESFVRRHLVHMKDVFEQDYYLGLLGSYKRTVSSLEALRKDERKKKEIQERLDRIPHGVDALFA